MAPIFSTAGLSLNTEPVLGADATVAKAQATGQQWILVVSDGKPLGWVQPDKLGQYPGDTPLAQARTEPVGHTFTVGTDSLRAALDAAVLSPAGQAVGVDGDGQVRGVATFDRLRDAVQAAQAAADADAGLATTQSGAPA